MLIYKSNLTPQQRMYVQKFKNRFYGMNLNAHNAGNDEETLIILEKHFEYLCRKSLQHQKINSCLIGAMVVCALFSWFRWSWMGLGVVFLGGLVLKFAIDAWQSHQIINLTGWETDELKAATAIVTEPEWREELSAE
jgi:hypothetical protein